MITKINSLVLKKVSLNEKDNKKINLQQFELNNSTDNDNNLQE